MPARVAEFAVRARARVPKLYRLRGETMSTKKDGATICRDPVMTAGDHHAVDAALFPTCERHDPSPVVKTTTGWAPALRVSVLREKDTPRGVPVRDTRSLPDAREYVDALQGLLTIAEGGR